MKYIISFLLCSLAVSDGFSQKISNIVYEFAGEDILVFYDIAGPESSVWHVDLFFSEDDGATWKLLKKVSGEVGFSITNGQRKKITWDRNSENVTIIKNIKFQVIAERDRFFATQSGTFTDERNGVEYKWIRINQQIWMAQNLNIGYAVEGRFDQANNGQIKKYCYNDLELNCTTYGGLYQWDEMMQYAQTEGSQGICPKYWHLPADWEWAEMIFYLGGMKVAYGRLKEVGTQHWKVSTKRTTNESRFTAIPAGLRTSDSAKVFLGIRDQASYWSSTEKDAGSAAAVGLGSQFLEVYFFNGLKADGYSVRCVRD